MTIKEEDGEGQDASFPLTPVDEQGQLWVDRPVMPQAGGPRRGSFAFPEMGSQAGSAAFSLQQQQMDGPLTDGQDDHARSQEGQGGHVGGSEDLNQGSGVFQMPVESHDSEHGSGAFSLKLMKGTKEHRQR